MKKDITVFLLMILNYSNGHFCGRGRVTCMEQNNCFLKTVSLMRQSWALPVTFLELNAHSMCVRDTCLIFEISLLRTEQIKRISVDMNSDAGRHGFLDNFA